MQTVVLKVAMSCKGCSGAVNRVLGKMEGVESYDIDMEQQKVTVVGNVQPEAVFQTVAKTGKKTAFWEEPCPAAEAKPADTTESKPAEAAEVKPAESVELKAAEAAESKPVEVAESKPAETAAPVATA